MEEAIPEKATSLEEANAEFKKSGWELGKGKIKKEADKSTARIDDLGNCYYPILDDFASPPSSGNRFYTFSGERMTFGYTELVKPYEETLQASAHEQFLYLLHGKLKAASENEHEILTAGGIMHIPKGSRYSLATHSNIARYVSVQSTSMPEKDL